MPLLNAVVAHIDHVDGPIGLIDGNATGEIELPVTIAEAAPGHDELSRHVELLDAEVGAVDHINVPAYPVYGNAPGRIELPFAVATRAELHEVAAQFPIKFLNTVVVRIDNPHVPFAVTGNAGR